MRKSTTMSSLRFPFISPTSMSGHQDSLQPKTTNRDRQTDKTHEKALLSGQRTVKTEVQQRPRGREIPQLPRTVGDPTHHSTSRASTPDSDPGSNRPDPPQGHIGPRPTPAATSSPTALSSSRTGNPRHPPANQPR